VTKAEKRFAGAVVALMVGPMASIGLLRQFVDWFNLFEDSITKANPDDNNGLVLWLNGQSGGLWVALALVLGQVAMLLRFKSRSLTSGECWGWGAAIFALQGPLLFLAMNDALNVAFGVSCFLTFYATLGLFIYGMHRPVGTPVTWGEAFLAAFFVLGLLMLAYGIVPNQFLFWADNELRWRKDSIGFPNPFGARFFPEGVSFLAPLLGEGRGKIIISKEAVRDVVVVGIYGAGLVGNFILWSWWQRRANAGTNESKEVEVSSYGRPLVRQA